MLGTSLGFCQVSLLIGTYMCYICVFDSECVINMVVLFLPVINIAEDRHTFHVINCHLYSGAGPSKWVTLYVGQFKNNFGCTVAVLVIPDILPV